MTPAPAEVVVERLAEAIDDGDQHGHAGDEQGEIQPLEEPPPSRDAFGADPQSEAAALAEVRATLEALLNDPDPAVKDKPRRCSRRSPRLSYSALSVTIGSIVAARRAGI